LREGQLTLRRINSLYFGWGASLDNQLSESAVSAANIDPLQPRGSRKPIKKDIARTSAPIPHHPLICGPVIEADLSFSHQSDHECPRWLTDWLCRQNQQWCKAGCFDGADLLKSGILKPATNFFEGEGVALIRIHQHVDGENQGRDCRPSFGID
jgi:hypothetical protein